MNTMNLVEKLKKYKTSYGDSMWNCLLEIHDDDIFDLNMGSSSFEKKFEKMFSVYDLPLIKDKILLLTSSDENELKRLEKGIRKWIGNPSINCEYNYKVFQDKEISLSDEFWKKMLIEISSHMDKYFRNIHTQEVTTN